ncbi:MAG: EAL domain-containing protein [Dechloromonas sp.]|nr:EAL domain-containing protein [Dechloromonas sp.]
MKKTLVTRIDALISTQIDRVEPDLSLREVAAHMLAARVSSVIVVEKGDILGIITERDIMRAMRRHRSPEQTARDTMSSPVHSVPADTPFQEAYREAIRFGIRRIVVTDAAGLPLGVVSESDFRKHLGPDFFLQLNTTDTLMERTFPRLPADASLEDALAAMEAVGASCIFVVDGRRPIGIVTEHDIVRFFVDAPHTPTLGQVMTQPAHSIQADRPLADAAQLMLKHDIRHLAVVDAAGDLIGQLSEHTLISPLSLGTDNALGEQESMLRSRERMVEETTRRERYQRTLLDTFPFLVWLKDTESRFLTTNRAFADAVSEANASAIVGKTDFDFWPPEMAEHFRDDDAAVMASREKRIIFEPVKIGDTTVWHETYKAPVVGDDGKLLGTVGFARDISERMRTEEAMRLRNAALAAVIGEEPLPRALELLVMSAEAEIPGWRCSIMLSDETGTHLHIGAAPSLPASYCAAIDGMPIADGVGSCGTAAALRQRIMVENVFEHPYWANYHDLARQGDIAACWSDPIIGPDGLLLGTFAAHHRSPGHPQDEYLSFLTQACQLAAVLIAHQRRSQDLGKSLEAFRSIFNSTSEALFIQSEDGTFLDVNAGAEQLAGLSRSQLIGLSHAAFTQPGLTDVETINQHILATLAGTPQTFEVLAKNSAGRIFPVEIRLNRAGYFGRTVVIASAVDISERMNAGKALEIEHDLAQALAAGKQREDVFQVLLQSALRFPDIDASCLFWRQADGSYQLVAHNGVSSVFADKFAVLDANSLFSRFARSGSSVCNCLEPSDHCADSSILDSEAILAEGLVCLAAQPIMLADQPVACMTLASRRSTGILPSTLHSLDLLGSRFSQTLLQLNAQEEARRIQQNLSGLFDTLNDFIFILDEDGRILHYNRAVAEGLGYGPSALIGKPITTVHPENLQKMATELMIDIVAGHRFNCSLPILHANGQQTMVETRVAHGYWNGRPALIGTSQDISERLVAEERQQLAASVFDNAHEGIMITDAAGRIIEVNSTFSELTGYTRDEAIGQTPELLKSGHHEPAFYQDMWRSIDTDGYWRGEIWNRKKSGEIFVELLTISSVRNRNGEIANFVAIFSDITVIKQHQQRLEHLAHYDALTQLPNRILLGDRLQLAMAHTGRSGKMLAICYLDLDNFKPINDRFGHSAGDFLLIEVAQRLKACVRAGDTVSRLGGDEFVLLISDLEDLHECDQAVGRVIGALTQPFRVSEHRVSISASIGVTLYPHDGADADTLLRHADQAMYAAKQGGRNRHHLFDPENDRRTRIRREEIVRISEGLENAEFQLYFQPKVNMRKGSVTGAEALIRWQHPEEGLLLPGRFLPSIADSELEIVVGDWVIREALRQMDEWNAQGVDLPISINISGKHLLHEGFTRRLADLLAAHPNIPPGRIELEVLETAALEDMAKVAALFADCRRMGISFALDDFGTGYSSLTYFRQLPADVLKIDQSFIRNMLDDADDLAIVEGVIGLTQAFRRQVIAEGVETVEHGLVLLLLGCDTAQGFGIARPMPAALLPEWIRQFKPDELWGLATACKWSREDVPMLIAEVDHNRWKKSLFAYLAEPAGTLRPPEQDHRQCRFGLWYYGPDGQRNASSEFFPPIEDLHKTLHDIGSQLRHSHAAGDHAAIEALKMKLEETSRKMTERIHQIQAEVLLNAGAPRN